MQQINTTVNHMQAAIDCIGAINKLAAVLGVTPQAVSFWRDGLRQLPADKCPAIERLTNGLVRCEMLRPDVDWAYIRNTPATPQTQQTQAQAAPVVVAAAIAATDQVDEPCEGDR